MRKALVGGAAVVREGGAGARRRATHGCADCADVPQQTVTHHEREVEKLSAPLSDCDGGTWAIAVGRAENIN